MHILLFRLTVSTEEKAGYYKADMKDKLSLCKKAESYVKSKEIIYKLINLPFDINNNALYDIWSDMVIKESDGKHRRFSLKDISVPSETEIKTLETLEQSHKICNLCYAYADRFGVYEDIDVIQYNKRIISEYIIEILKTAKMEKRKCRECRKVLPWNYKYPLCNECHNKIYPKYYDMITDLVFRKTVI